MKITKVLLAATIAAFALPAAAACASAPVHASMDSDYLGCLKNNNIIANDPKGADDAQAKLLGLGKTISQDLGGGRSPASIENTLVNSGNFTGNAAHAIVGCVQATIQMNAPN